MSSEHSPSSEKIPVVFCVDVEPDEFFVDPANPKPWSGFEFGHGYLKGFRARFEKATGRPVHFNWFVRFDPQVAIAYGNAAWAVERYAEFFDEYRSRGDEIGIHVHTYNWSKTQDAWIDDSGNEEWTAHCLQSSFDAFKQVFGDEPRCLRFGNYWLSTAAVNQAEELGIEFDLTIEPGLDAARWGDGSKPTETGLTPSFFRVPRVPYPPSRRDFKKRQPDGGRNITMMPLTSAYRSLGWSLRGIRRRLGRIRRNGFAARLQEEPLSMWRTWSGKDPFGAMLDRAIALQERPYLAFAVRSDMNLRHQTYDSCLNALLEHPAASRFVFGSPRDVMRHLETSGARAQDGAAAVASA
jgi:hypothetical protein